MRLISAGSLVRAQSGPLFRAISQVRCFPSVTNKNRLYARQTRDGVPIKHVISYYHQKRRVVSHGSDNGFAQSVQRSSKPFPLPKSRTIRHNSPMIPLLSGSMGASHTFCDWMLLYAVGLPAHAATITVTNTNDSGPGSLRHALANANNLDTINFAVTGTIAPTSGGLQVTKNVAISGPGSNPVLEKRVLSQPSG